MTALTTLKGIGRQLDSTGLRVSTGQRVSSAADNAAYWSIATAVRADNAALSAVKDALGLGASTVETAYNGLNAVLGDLRSLRATLQTALQPGIDRARIQTQIAALQVRMKATADASASGGRNWLSVNSADAGYRAVETMVSGIARDGSDQLDLPRIAVDVGRTALYDAAAAPGTVAATAARITAGAALPPRLDFRGASQMQLSLSVDGAAAQDLVLGAATLAAAVPDLAAVRPAELVAALNNLIAGNPALNGAVRAGLDPAGRLWFETVAAGAGKTLTVDRTSGVPSAPPVNLIANGGFESGIAGWVQGGDMRYNLISPDAHGGTASWAFGTLDTTTTTLTQTVATAPGQTYDLGFWLHNDDTLPSSFFKVYWNGSLVLARGADPRGPFVSHTVAVTAAGTASTLTFEARQPTLWWYLDDVTLTRTDASSEVTLGFGSGPTDHRTASGTDASATAGRGILDTVEAGTGASVSTIDIAGLDGPAGDAALRGFVDQVERALARVTEAGVRLGAGRTQIDGQRSFLDTLTKANDRAIGILVDADIEEEATRLKALQTQQQLALQALSIANASSQPLLMLIRQ